MIEFIVLIILIIVLIALLFLFTSHALVFIINILMLILVLPQILNDIKKRKMASFYLLSVFLTALVFISNKTFLFKWLFDFMYEAYILSFVQAIFLIFVLAHLSALVYFKVKDLKKRKKQHTH